MESRAAEVFRKQQQISLGANFNLLRNIEYLNSLLEERKKICLRIMQGKNSKDQQEILDANFEYINQQIAELIGI